MLSFWRKSCQETLPVFFDEYYFSEDSKRRRERLCQTGVKKMPNSRGKFQFMLHQANGQNEEKRAEKETKARTTEEERIKKKEQTGKEREKES